VYHSDPRGRVTVHTIAIADEGQRDHDEVGGFETGRIEQSMLQLDALLQERRGDLEVLGLRIDDRQGRVR
jgi:hypothetical protein